MTENEAIERLNCLLTLDGDFTCGEVVQATELAVSVLKEIQQYRAIGTVEECREAIGKYNPLSTIEPAPKKRRPCYECGCTEIEYREGYGGFCKNCGTILDFEELDDDC